MELRIREAVHQSPPRLLYMLYQARNAPAPTWRHIAPYSIREKRTKDNEPLLYAACEKEQWKVEAFDLRRIKDLQVTNKPWPFSPEFAVEF